MRSKLTLLALAAAMVFGATAVASAQTEPAKGASTSSNAASSKAKSSNSSSNAMASMHHHKMHHHGHHHMMAVSGEPTSKSRPGGRPVSRKPAN